ncbi:MAG TPA: low-specificity L-threonine aldolase [Candidatus Binataceae bacterium]|nr:low-specificity L-threonine aldolase [Candidatus Binataceae bacterium]
MIDLRSDTVTLPSEAMREAMARAELGDDVFGEDPTVNRLQERAAALMGKEAALLVASGTMANLIALLVHCRRGTKAIVGSRSHSYVYEGGGASALGGIVFAPVRNLDDGQLDLSELAYQVATPPDAHFAPPALVTLENTHNQCGGVAVPLSHMREVATIARGRGLATHLDGARIFNAALALESEAVTLAAEADSVSFCLSKGLACPVGSLLCGSAAFIQEAHRVRKVLGGGMRQAGIIAAAGLIALDQMIDRLGEDHSNARALAQGLGLIAGLQVWPAARRTNMVFFDVEGEEAQARSFEAEMRSRGVLIGRRGGVSFRAVAHYGIDRGAIDRTVMAAQAAAKALSN